MERNISTLTMAIVAVAMALLAWAPVLMFRGMRRGFKKAAEDYADFPERIQAHGEATRRQIAEVHEESMRRRREK